MSPYKETEELPEKPESVTSVNLAIGTKIQSMAPKLNEIVEEIDKQENKRAVIKKFKLKK